MTAKIAVITESSKGIGLAIVFQDQYLENTNTVYVTNIGKDQVGFGGTDNANIPILEPVSAV